VASHSQHKGSNAPSCRRLVVDEERSRPGHWLGSVFRVSVNALTLMIGDRKDIWLVKNVNHLSPNVLFRKKTDGKNG